ncbi:MAG: hypothetical protein V3S29_03475, partial [bacterium]
MRLLWMALVALLLFGQAPALGRGLMLNEEARTDFSSYGWTFYGLSAAMLLLASQSYTASQDALATANANYVSYQATPTTDLQTLAEAFLSSAQAEETKANAALFLSVLFGVTGYYSFHPEDLPETTIFVHPRG